MATPGHDPCFIGSTGSGNGYGYGYGHDYGHGNGNGYTFKDPAQVTTSLMASRGINGRWWDIFSMRNLFEEIPGPKIALNL